jgi:hypothetical protein
VGPKSTYAKALKTEHREAAIASMFKELKQEVDMKSFEGIHMSSLSDVERNIF